MHRDHISVPNYRALTRAVHTNVVPAGAFRGFGVPQAAIAQEQLYDELADQVGIDRLEFRILNALRNDTPTVTGQILGEGVGIGACFEALRPKWQAHEEFNSVQRLDHRAHAARSWRGRHVVWLRKHFAAESFDNAHRTEARRTHCACTRGRSTSGKDRIPIVTQICADAVGAPVVRFDLVSGDTSISPDCGKTSASRQTFVTGKAAHMAGTKLRERDLEVAGRM